LTRVRGKKRLDLDFDSPPDLAIEVDVTNPTLDKMAIYAGLGVPEVWRFDDGEVEFYRLAGKRYQRVSTSALFPFLTPSVVADHLRIGDVQSINAMSLAFRDWVRAHKP
jgi:Uma2 family endonuclease